MSSQSDDHQSKQNQSNHHPSRSTSTSSSLSSSDTNNNDHLSSPSPPAAAAPPPPQPDNPPAMGYPPQMMYPNAPYPTYPPPYHDGYNQHPYTHNGYYVHGYASVSPPQYNRYRCSGFCRGIIAAMILLIVIFCISVLIKWAILRPQLPNFYVNNMSVSNFNTSSNPFTATWDMNVTLENPNHKLRLYLDKIRSSMYHEDEGTESLGSSWLHPIFMEIQTNNTMHVVISANDSAENAVPIWLVQEMSKDRAKGSVIFVLRFQLSATLKTKSGSLWTRSLLWRVYCDDLKVNFVGSSGNGTLAPGERDDCKVYT